MTDTAVRHGLRHVLHTKQFSLELLDNVIYPEARRMRELIDAPGGRDELRSILRHKILLSHFYEPSTRTRLSFEFAAVHLGMHVLTTENAGEFSSAAKGETVRHSIRVLSSFRPDVVIMRHKQDGITNQVAQISRVPIINGGDGTEQHPSQAFLDRFTILDEKGRVDGLTFAFGGDLCYGRTARSLIYLVAKSPGVRITLISHERFRMRDDIKGYLKENNVPFVETDSIGAIRGADVVYWTRTQTERIGDEALKEQIPEIRDRFTIGLEQMSWMKADAILMHPMPIIWEVRPEVDDHPRAAYFRQAENGLFVRMALLKWVVLGGNDDGYSQNFRSNTGRKIEQLLRGSK